MKALAFSPRLLLLGLLLLTLSLPLQAREVWIELQGLDDADELRENIIATLSLARYREEGMGEPRLRRLHARAPNEIRQALRPFGYYDVRVESELTYREEEENWLATYQVERGPQIHVVEVNARVEGEGADDRAFLRTLAELPIRENQPLDHRNYEQAKNRLLQLADRRGYLDARWVSRGLFVDPPTQTARVQLVLDSGPRYNFGPVTIEQDIMDDAFVQRYVPFDVGEPFDADKLLQLQYGLSDSEYYNYVEVRPERDQIEDDRQIPIHVDAHASPKHRYRASLGYGTDTGPRYGVRWENRRVNRRGHRGALGYNISDVRRAVEMRYVVPLSEPVNERLTWDANAIREDRGDFESRRLELGVGRSTLQWGWLQTTFLRYEQERSIFGPEDQSRSEVVVPGITWSRTRANDPTLPRRGLRLSLDVRGAREELLSDLNFFQTTLRAKRVQPLGERHRLLARLELGGTGSERFENLPLSQRFFTGGDQTVRGFGYEELSPLDEEGRRIGGRYLAVASLEVDRQISGPWYAAAFVDSGNAMMSFSDSLETSAGIGMRYASPIGMIRVDIARPISDPDRGYRLHLSVGPDL
ncbi:translocation and assembly module TamA [Natronospira proteinivora]|uniref:Translocation and assembly module subunit TamA n=1 Tax=Natronospira proteinivora TaxID=1807133 RepID=A0ABT1GAB1_9GAMM|nr:autotransporter assembly complex family protein [Natronospira proteinivora]MCP1728256.1 translocation and assembly module TamA [Natronospira proteinivora]